MFYGYRTILNTYMIKIMLTLMKRTIDWWRRGNCWNGRWFWVKGRKNALFFHSSQWQVMHVGSREGEEPKKSNKVLTNNILSTFEYFLLAPIERWCLKWQTMKGVVCMVVKWDGQNRHTGSFWHTQSGRAIFWATLPLNLLTSCQGMIRFYDQDTRPMRRVQEKLPFRGRCAFKQ